MNSRTVFFLSFLVGLLISYAPLYAAAESSIYSVPFSWIDETGKAFKLNSLEGKPVVVAMLYTRCKNACPLTVGRLKEIEKRVKTPLQFVLVSFDAEGDSAKTLFDFKQSHKLAGSAWHLLHGTESDIRKLSVLLGISFQRDSETNEFLHSNKIILLNSKGNIEYTLEGLASDVALLLDHVK